MQTIVENFSRGYRTSADRSRAIKNMFRRSEGKVNYFVCYKDVHAEFALHFGHATWVSPGTYYLNR